MTDDLQMTLEQPAGGVAVRSSDWLAGRSSWRSVYDTNDEILTAIMHLHCPDGYECDMTFGNGSFWKRLPRPRLCYDITPLHEGVTQADSR